MLRDALALLAKDAIGIQVIAEPFKASGIVGELAVEILLRVLPHLRLAIHRLTYSQVQPIRMLTYCQGIITDEQALRHIFASQHRRTNPNESMKLRERAWLRLILLPLETHRKVPEAA